MKCHLDVGPIRIGNLHWQTAFEYILDKGLVEFGLINGESQLPFILNWYNSNIIFLQKKKIQLIEILDIILNKGIVFSCNRLGTSSIISSLESYLKYAEAVDQSEISETCCINIFGNISQTYNIIKTLNEGINFT
jgi:hypothetical protein